MNRWMIGITLLFFVTSCNLPLSVATPTPSAPTAAAPTTMPAPATPAAGNRFGVFAGGEAAAAAADYVNAAKALAVGWVRINVTLGVSQPDYTRYLEAGINVILMMNNQDPANVIETYGTVAEWPQAGFPFKSKEKYQQDIRAFLEPALPYLAQGRQVLVQAENEATDVTVNPKELFWRGTDDQYLAQLQALHEAVKAVSGGFPVVMTSFASAELDALNDAKAPRHQAAVDHITRLLAQGQYDVIDLHFYGCAADIPAKIAALKARLPAGRAFTWISTENGGPDFRCQSTPVSWKDNLTQFEQEEAAEVPVRLSACAANGAQVCLWFSLFDIKGAEDVFSHLGLLDQASGGVQKKPAYAAFQVFLAQQK